jgi:type I restriction enzyme M protein
MLPMVVIRRLDCVLEPTKDLVVQKNKELASHPDELREVSLNQITGHKFHNVSNFTLQRLIGDPDKIAANLLNYIKGFSKQAQDIIDHFRFEEQIGKLEKNNRLFLVVQKFCEIDLHPEAVSNIEMGYIFEELIRKFNEASNEEAGDHFTPRDVIRLMVNLLFTSDSDLLARKGIIKTIYDPACGTGGMLSVSESYLREINPDARLELYGQDYNDNAFAICGSEMLIKGQNPEDIKFGDSFTDDQFPGQKFDYLLANPPFGVEWKPQEDFVKKEYEKQGYGGRFGAGLPPINDGALLFLQHMISKMQAPSDGGSRIGIVFNGSAFFTGSAESGPSNIRRWIIENDWLEAIVALPRNLYYNTGISTYIWILTNRKTEHRKGKIQLIDARQWYRSLGKNFGNKTCELSPEDISRISNAYTSFIESEQSKIIVNKAFGYRRVIVDRPLRLTVNFSDESLKSFKLICNEEKEKDFILILEKVSKDIGPGPHLDFNLVKAAVNFLALRQGVKMIGKRWKLIENGLAKNDEKALPIIKRIHKSENMKPDPVWGLFSVTINGRPEVVEYESDNDLKNFIEIPLLEDGDIEAFFNREVLPCFPDAWLEKNETQIWYKIIFNRYFAEDKLKKLGKKYRLQKTLLNKIIVKEDSDYPQKNNLCFDV